MKKRIMATFISNCFVADIDEPKVRAVLNEVLEERRNQDFAFGRSDHPASTWLALMGEEFGEVSRAICEDDGLNYRSELIQLAALCVSAVEAYDRA